MPHLTLSFGHGNGGDGASGDLSVSCLGLGCLIAWVLAAGLGMPAMLAEAAAPFPIIGAGTAMMVRAVFLIALVASLLFVGASNQRFLRFYVGQRPLLLGLAACLAGTFMGAFAGADGVLGIALAICGPILMGMGAGLLFPLWGTVFARSEYATITLNAIGGVALGVFASVALIDLIPAIVSLPIAAIFACISVLILWHMTPVPYYRRRELPAFHALRVSRVRFLLHLGIPVLVFGVALGILGAVCAKGAFCTGNTACDLLVGAACALCLVIFIASIALFKDEAHWDTLFRYMLPIVGVGMIGVPLFCGAYQLGAVFLMAAGFVTLLALIWIMFSDMSQEFRLSPIFVFGVGSGLLLAGAAFGSLLVPPVDEWQTMSSVRWTGLAMGAIVCLMLAGAINPRKRDVLKMLPETRPIIEMSAVNQMVVDDAAARGAEATDEQMDAAGAEVVAKADDPAFDDAIDPDSAARARAAAAFAENASLLMGIPIPAERGDTADALHQEKPASEETGEPRREKGSFYRRCEEIADRYMLSRRETEVFFLLAKGHKAGFIEDKLCVSRSTAKTHINHIYKKMDIHTQQELLNMVEDRPRPHQSPEDIAAAMPASHPMHHGF